MNTQRIISIFALLVLAFVANAIVTGDSASAQTSDSRQVVVVVADGDAIRRDDQGVALTRSLVGLIATLRESGSVMFITVDDPYTIVGPFSATDPDFSGALDEVDHRVLVGAGSGAGGLQEAIAEAYGILGGERASSGSSVYLVTGGDSPLFSRLESRMGQLTSRYNAKGWTINGVNLDGSSDDAVAFLTTLSSETSGGVFELSVADGLRQLADDILAGGAQGSLSEVGQRMLTLNELLTSAVSVAPGTSETTMVLFKESAYGSLRLSNPSGLEASAGDRTASYVVETPHAVIWKLIDPVPGTWRIDARGMEGLISAWAISSNKYRPVLQSMVTVPLDKAANMVAFVADELGGVAMLENARIFANVGTPDGGNFVLEMKDDGIQADSRPNDGYYSATLPPLRIEGGYNVELELSWDSFAHRISSQGAFDAQAFPNLDVTTHSLTDLEPGQRTQIATVAVHVQGEPYPVSVDQLEAILGSPAGVEGRIEIEPRRLFGDGPAWEYNVYFTPVDHGSHTVLFRLEMEYAGRLFAHNSEALAITTVAVPAPQPEPVEAPDPVQQETAQAAPIPPALVPTIVPPKAEFPWVLLAVPALLLVGVVSVIGYLYTRSQPFGYLYNDRDEPLVDFSTIRRGPIARLFFRNSVRGMELSAPGLENIVFKFSGDKIKVENTRHKGTVRVNNQPLIGQTVIGDKTWIGTGGKLYTFLLAPQQSMGEASADD